MGGDENVAKTLSGPDDLVPCFALCCMIESCYCDWPECIGCRGRMVICCLSGQGMCCKPACACCGHVNPELKKDPDTCCVCQDANIICISPSTCFSTEQQVNIFYYFVHQVRLITEIFYS